MAGLALGAGGDKRDDGEDGVYQEKGAGGELAKLPELSKGLDIPKNDSHGESALGLHAVALEVRYNWWSA